MQNLPKKNLSLLVFIRNLPNQKAQLETMMSSRFPEEYYEIPLKILHKNIFKYYKNAIISVSFRKNINIYKMRTSISSQYLKL